MAVEQFHDVANGTSPKNQADGGRRELPSFHLSIPEYPVLAENVELVGEMPDTGFVERQWLIKRDDKFIQLSELLYRVAELATGENSLEEIAQSLTKSTEWQVTADHIRLLVNKLLPLGVIDTNEDEDEGDEQDWVEPAANEPRQARVLPALGFNLRTKVISPSIIDPIAGVLQNLYRPFILVPMLLCVLVMQGWFYIFHSATQGLTDLLFRPWAIPIILLVLLIGGVFHEFGHASALRYSGGQVRGMGVGIYLLYPAFYTDVTDSYRLGRAARVRTDLGGFYFNLIFTLILFVVYLFVRQEYLLFAIVLIDIDILYELMPFVRLDGYWAFSDLTGIPDFLSMTEPFIASLLKRPESAGKRLPPLKPRVKKIFFAYVLLTIPALIAGVVFSLYRLPYYFRTTMDSFLLQLRVFQITWHTGNLQGLIVLGASLFLLAVMVVGSIYVFFRVGGSAVRGLWNWSKPTIPRRVGGVFIAISVIALLANFWSPYSYLITHRPPAGVTAYSIASHQQVQGKVQYLQNPPVGGNYAWAVQNCGFYDQPVAAENAVHSLAVGAVWIAYRPDLPANQIRDLRLMANYHTYVLVSPYPGLKAPVVASAWGQQLALSSAEDIKLDQFVRAFRLAKGAPQSGMRCSGGAGMPK